MRDNLDREITYLRISVTDLCNLRCHYCMPAEGVCKLSHKDMLTQEELILAIKAAASLGITKIRFTGGEPLVKKNIVSICKETKQIPGIKEICLTTNATLLPNMALDLKKAGVSRINISLDSLTPEKYKFITRGGSLDEALSGLSCALNAGFSKIKINAVLIRGFNDDEVGRLCELTLKYPIDVRFIELMPMVSGEFSAESYMNVGEVLDLVPELTPAENPEPGNVAKLYRLPKALGNVGLISPISSHFCGDCNRIRLTADGKLKPCLHSNEEIPIKGLSYDEMVGKFKEAIYRKPAWHGALGSADPSRAERFMNQIGG